MVREGQPAEELEPAASDLDEHGWRITFAGLPDRAVLKSTAEETRSAVDWFRGDHAEIREGVPALAVHVSRGGEWMLVTELALIPGGTMPRTLPEPTSWTLVGAHRFQGEFAAIAASLDKGGRPVVLCVTEEDPEPAQQSERASLGYRDGGYGLHFQQMFGDRLVIVTDEVGATDTATRRAAIFARSNGMTVEVRPGDVPGVREQIARDLHAQDVADQAAQSARWAGLRPQPLETYTRWLTVTAPAESGPAAEVAE